MSACLVCMSRLRFFSGGLSTFSPCYACTRCLCFFLVASNPGGLSVLFVPLGPISCLFMQLCLTKTGLTPLGSV